MGIEEGTELGKPRLRMNVACGLQQRGSAQRQRRGTLKGLSLKGMSVEHCSRQHERTSPEFILLSERKKKSGIVSISTTHCSLWCTHNFKTIKTAGWKLE